MEPVDEYQGAEYVSKDGGTRYLLTHGGIWGDYALVAEGTDFGLAWVEAGKAFFKVTVYGDAVYTPWLDRSKGPNVIVKASKLVEAIDSWGEEFSQRRVREYAGGTVHPKVQVSAIRGGSPYYVTTGCEFCDIYVDVRLLPGEDPRAPERELNQVLAGSGFPGEVRMFAHRRGYEAQGAEPLVGAISRAQQAVLGRKPGKAATPFSSMWRDTNVFNELGIPSVTYGPKRRCPIPVSDMVNVAKVYALTALEICGA
jgi:acetylornithine deacetylase/succinyl-diaminopimelate desuccinylase-like protein